MTKNLSNIANEFNAKQTNGLIAMLENQRINDQAIAIVKHIENYKNTVGDPRYDAGLQVEVAGFVLAHDMTPGEWLKNHVSD